MVDQNQPPTFDIFSCPLCNNGVYPIYDHDLKIYSSIAAWLKDDLKLQAISKVLSEYTVKLFDSNITTVEKLKFKLENNAHFLVNIGFDAYDAGYISDRLKGVATSSGSGSSSYTGTGGAAPTPPVAPVVRQSHRDLLIKFYRQCNGEKWDKGRNWCSNAALADWHGVSVEPHTENVTKIQLPSNNIVGKLPAEWSGLSTLIKLDLSDNQLTGDCPPSWGALTKLEVLYLRDNILTGTLPAAWSSLVALTALDLNGNELGGVVPQEWDALTSLNACIIYNNYFDCKNNDIRLILPNCRNIDAEMPESDDGGMQTELDRIDEGDEATEDTEAYTEESESFVEPVVEPQSRPTGVGIFSSLQSFYQSGNA